jgi:hypothetical protein
METQIFHHAKNIIFKKSSKRNENPSRYYNSITNFKKAKISSFKNSHIKIDILIPRGQNPLRYYILYSEYKHNILALVGKANKINDVSQNV